MSEPRAPRAEPHVGLPDYPVFESRHVWDLDDHELRAWIRRVLADPLQTGAWSDLAVLKAEQARRWKQAVGA